MLSLRDLRFARGPEPPVFDGFSAEIGPGLTWVIGDEGSGKTTLLALLAGRLAGDGTVVIDGAAFDLRQASTPRPVAWCDAADAALDRLAVGAFLDRLRAAAPAFDDAVLARHVTGFALAPHLGKAMFQLSTGTRRKVALAGALSMRAAVTLLDDPAAALDAPSVGHLRRALAEVDADPRRVCLATAYAPPPGVAPAKRLVLAPPRR